jgi:succinoglycan biosynthesis transport protein ExoP
MFTQDHDEDSSQLRRMLRQRARKRLFMGAVGSVILTGLLAAVFTPRLYQSSATVLVSARTAIDVETATANVQGTAIQRRVLLGSEITRRLEETLDSRFGGDLGKQQLAAALAVTPEPETNLLEVSATLSDDTLPPLVVRTWIEVYSEVRAADIALRKEETTGKVEDEIAGLATEIEATRIALDEFRRKHEIISIERAQNAEFARLDGLNASLNNAVEAEVAAQARLAALKSSLSAGDKVIPGRSKAEVEAMANELAEMRVRLVELRAKYTQAYIDKDARLRKIPEKVAELETDLQSAYSTGASEALAEAELEYAAARSAVADLQQRLSAQEAEVAAFNTVYSEHEALSQDLKTLEQLSREAQARLARINAQSVERYPQVTVIDMPGRARRISPDYLVIAGATTIAALLVSIVAVWLYDYLNPESREHAYLTLTGVNYYAAEERQPREIGSATSRLGVDPRRLEQDSDPHRS